MKTVIVGMSGGVDSSVTAALLKEQGFNVVGVYMKNWSEDFGDFGCTWAEDSEDARKVAQKLNIPFYVWNFEKEYREKVVEYFLREYQANRTPNPDVMCNSEIKFKIFLERALKLGADLVATGHYAQIKKHGAGNTYQLCKGVDPAKDQSYFLYTLQQEQLAKILFPLGSMKKSEVRTLARKFALPNAEKKDSQGICFIGKIDVREFLKAHLKAVPGKVITTSGEVLGMHDGLPFYTIGQREGIGLGGKGPYYVVEKNIPRNELIVSNDPKDPSLWKQAFTISDLSWTGQPANFPIKTGVSIRYHHPETPALLEIGQNATLRARFDQPERAITTGQAAVFYQGDVLIGGGIIAQVH